MTTAKNPKRKIIKDKDYELVQAINSGQYDLFHDLVKRYEQKLYNFSLRMCRNPSDAQDNQSVKNAPMLRVYQHNLMGFDFLFL